MASPANRHCANSIGALSIPRPIQRVIVTVNHRDLINHNILMPAGFRRHLVGKTLINVFRCDIAEIRFVGKLVIILTFS